MSQEEQRSLDTLLNELLEEENILTSKNEIIRVSLKEFLKTDKQDQISKILEHRFNYWSNKQ